MATSKRVKKLIRQRMNATDENYTTARRNVLNTPAAEVTPSGPLGITWKLDPDADDRDLRIWNVDGSHEYEVVDVTNGPETLMISDKLDDLIAEFPHARVEIAERCQAGLTPSPIQIMQMIDKAATSVQHERRTFPSADVIAAGAAPSVPLCAACADAYRNGVEPGETYCEQHSNASTDRCCSGCGNTPYHTPDGWRGHDEDCDRLGEGPDTPPLSSSMSPSMDARKPASCTTHATTQTTKRTSSANRSKRVSPSPWSAPQQRKSTRN